MRVVSTQEHCGFQARGSISLFTFVSQSFGKYQLEKKLASGGMAEVWLARQTGIEGFNRHVVIKRILPHLAEEPEFVQMFLNEAKIASRFSHANIAQIFDLGENGGTYFIAMEFVHGEDLGRIIRRAWTTNQWLARPIAIRIVADACAALHYAHTRTDEMGRALKVVHRDVSPQNILVSFDGAVKLVDFGIAKAADQVSNTASGALKGKFAYMSPEQASGKMLDARSDIFSLGLVLYELMTGVKPLKRESELATLQAAIECEIEKPSEAVEVPPEIDSTVMAALAREPDDRYRDAREFQMALEALLVAEGTVATSLQVSDMMSQLFADRLEEEAKLGTPMPASASSTNLKAVSRTNNSKPRRGSGDGDDDDDPNARTLAPDRDGEDRSVQDLSKPGPPVAASEPALQHARQETVRPNTVEYNFKPERGAARPIQVSNSGSHTVPIEEIEAGRQKGPALAFGASRDTDHDDELERNTDGQSGDGANREGELEEEEEGEQDVRRPASLLRPGPFAPSMPDAPARRSRVGAALGLAKPSAIVAAVPMGRLDARSTRIQAALRRNAAMRTTSLVIIGLLLVVAAAGFTVRDRLPSLIHDYGELSESVPVLLTITSNPPTRVTVISSNGDEARDLGFTSIDKAPGAFVGDTVVLTNVDRGIHYEQVIESGKVNEIKMIDKVFAETYLRVRTKPVVKNGSVWLNNVQLGRVGTPIKVFEGNQTFEVRGETLERAVPFQVRLDPTRPMHDEELDVSKVIRNR